MVLSSDIEEDFSLEQWMQSQDVSERDETLDEESGRMYLLHQNLSFGNDAYVLAAAITDSDSSAITSLARFVDSDEPRFAVMVLVDLLETLNAGRTSSETDSRYRKALQAVASVIDIVVEGLCAKAKQGDICEDSLYYCLTLISYLLREKSELSQESTSNILEVTAAPRFLKVVMRIWKCKDLVGHFPGSDEEDHSKGLGFAVTVFLQSIVSFPQKKAAYNDKEQFQTSLLSGLAALVQLGEWFIAFWCLRMYSSDVSRDERSRLIDVMWQLVQFDVSHSRNLVFCELRVLQAVCHSVLNVSVEDFGVETLERLDCDTMTAVVAAGSELFLHLKFIKAALCIISTPGFIEENSVSVLGISWFWNAMIHCAEILKRLNKFNDSFGKVCTAVLKLQCSLSSLTSILWNSGVFLVTMKFPMGMKRVSILCSRQIVQKFYGVSSWLKTVEHAPWKAQCVHYLAHELLRRHTLSSPISVKISSVRAFCEWCLAINIDESQQLRACSGCGLARFCCEEHFRTQWKHCHKKGCHFFKSGELKFPKDETLTFLVRGQNGDIFDRGRGVRLGDLYASGGVKALCDRYGSITHSLGCGMRVTETSFGQFNVNIVPRGSLLYQEYSTLVEDGVAEKLLLLEAMSVVARNLQCDVCLVRKDSTMCNGRSDAVRHACSASLTSIGLFPVSNGVDCEEFCAQPGCDGHNSQCVVAE